MGTRATYLFRERYNHEGTKKYQDYGLIYTQFDGYPDGVPYDFVDYLNSGKVVNGIGSDDGLVFNGMGCLMASLIAKFKDGPGGLYMSPIKHRGNSWENYLYTIILDWESKELSIIVYGNGDRKKKIFEGTLPEYLEHFKSE